MEIFNEGYDLGSLIFSFLLVLIITFIAVRAGYFRLPLPPSPLSPTFLQLLGAFVIYPLIALIIIPFIYLASIYLRTGSLSALKTMPKVWYGWFQLLGILLIFIFLLIYCFSIRRKYFYAIIWGNKEPSFYRFLKNIGMGFLTWCISYPFVIFLGIITGLISKLIWGKSGIDQVAVRQLKMTLGHPLLFILTVFAVIIIVPFLEELLFRGFLQSWLRKYFGRLWAIILAAVIFTFVHFAPSQGIGNFQLIISLFPLAFFLGFLYERERTLWASYGLHLAFNGISVIGILISS